MSEGKRTPLLGEHKRIKSKLVTPFNDAFGSMREVSWINMMIPELRWIALVQYGRNQCPKTTRCGHDQISAPQRQGGRV